MAATENSVIYQGAFGVRRLGAAARMSTDTVFRIASMVKLLTSVAALQLVERGKLRLDEPAARIDPTLESPMVLDGFDAQGAPQLRAARKPITLRNLLTHTSGFSYLLWDANVVRYIKARAQRSSPAAHAADVRSRYQMGLWRQSRPGQPAGGNRKWRNPRSLFPRSHPRPAQHERYRPSRSRRTSVHARQPACPPGRRHTCSEASGETDGPESIFRRRRHLFHRAGLPDLASGAAEWRERLPAQASCSRRRSR